MHALQPASASGFKVLISHMNPLTLQIWKDVMSVHYLQSVVMHVLVADSRVKTLLSIRGHRTPEDSPEACAFSGLPKYRS